MGLTVRPADAADADAVLARYNERVAWLVAQGRTDQWGDTPFSQRPDWIRRVRSRVAVPRAAPALPRRGHGPPAGPARSSSALTSA